MKTEDTVNQFSEALILMAGLSPYMEDSFFIKKLRAKMQIFISGYIKFGDRGEDKNVAQYYLIEKLISDTNDILELFELISYLRLIKETTPLLLASKSLLALKLEFIGVKNNLTDSINKKENDASMAMVSKSDNKNQALAKTIVVSQKSINQNRELNPNKEKILNFIKHSPHTRTKDIIHEFNAISDRTVKRNLCELLRVGLINKKIENKAVYYSAEN